jgi:hypothetical protein
LHPGQVRIDAVDRQAQQLAIHALEQVGLLGVGQGRALLQGQEDIAFAGTFQVKK